MFAFMGTPHMYMQVHMRGQRFLRSDVCNNVSYLLISLLVDFGGVSLIG